MIKEYKRVEYALYDGDKFITIGSLKEIAEFLNITYESLLTYRAKNKKYIFVKLEKEENE